MISQLLYVYFKDMIYDPWLEYGFEFRLFDLIISPAFGILEV